MGVNLITLTIDDADGERSSVSVYCHRNGLSTETDLVNDYVEPLWNAIRPLVTGVLSAATVTLEVDIGDFTNNSPDALSDIQEKALFAFVPCGGWRAIRLSLPTVNELIFTQLGAGAEVDRTNSDVAVFSVLMTEDLGSGGINATDSHDHALCRMESGIQFFKG